MSMDGAPAPASPSIRAPEALRKKLAKIGLHSEADLLVHLPLRYEDETCITRVIDAPWANRCRSRWWCSPAKSSIARAGK